MDEFACRNREERIEVEVLRISERSEHAAEVRCNILENKDERHIFFVFCAGEDDIAEGEERDERHIVRDQHRSYECDIHKGNRCKAKIFRDADETFRADIEESDLTECTDDRKGTEEAGESTEIEITEILCIGRNDKRSEESESSGNCKNGILTHEAEDGLADITDSMEIGYQALT